MPEQPRIQRAQLIEVVFDEETGSRRADQRGSTGRGGSGANGASGGEGVVLTVQFNPQTLEITYENQNANSDQPENVGSQFVGRGMASLSTELLFDATRDDRPGVRDVRDLTGKLRYFMKPTKEKKTVSRQGGTGQNGSGQSQKEVYVQRGVRFQWGEFMMEGVMDSMDETLEFFDEQGRPLRATVSIGITQYNIRLEEENRQPGAGLSVGVSAGAGGSGAEVSVSAGGGGSVTSVQQLAGEAGRPGDWKSIARANGVENPRAIRNPGALDLNR